MSNDRNSHALVPVAELHQLAGMLAKSSLLPPDLKGKEADIAVTVMAGRELGLAPMAALRGVHVVKGKPVLSADTMVGIALSSGFAEYFSCIESTATIATYETKRKGSPHPQRLSFTIQQANAAGLNGGNWKSYPEAMLRARAKAALARDVYPDALAGCYEEDEARGFAEDDGGRRPTPASAPAVTPIQAASAIDAEVVERPAQAPAPRRPDIDAITLDLIADIEAAATYEALKALSTRFDALPRPSPQRDQAGAAYVARKNILTAPAQDGAAA